MKFEQIDFNNNFEKESIKVEIESNYQELVPAEFKNNPLGYFEQYGQPIKSGRSVTYDSKGQVKEDPFAVRDLPVWIGKDGQKIEVVAKMVNLKKGIIAEKQQPFYEYDLMKLLKELNLPSPEVVGKVKSKEGNLILMKKIPGFRLVGEDKKYLLSILSEDDIENLRQELEMKMAELKARFEKAGIERDWKISDMVVDIDLQAKTIKSIIPTDWERTKVDYSKIKAYKEQLNDRR